MPAKPQTAAQIKTLEKLTQASAARLLGISTRTLRDSYDAPRNGDGSYSGPALVAWSRDRLDRPELSESDHERVLQIRDVMEGCSVTEGEAAAIMGAMHELRQRYGEKVLLFLSDAVLASWGDMARVYEITSDHTEDVFRFVVKCDRCARVRRGRKWVKADAPTGFRSLEDRCPDCSFGGEG